MHEYPKHMGNGSTILVTVEERCSTSAVTKGLWEMSRATLLPLVIVVFLAMAAFLGMATSSEKTHAWIILDFKTARGHLSRMAFRNPDTLNEDECRDSLPKALESLIHAAIQQAPSLRRATVIGARCTMSVSDPLRESGKL